MTIDRGSLIFIHFEQTATVMAWLKMQKCQMPWNGPCTLLDPAMGAKISIRVSVMSLVIFWINADMDPAGTCFTSVKKLVANVSLMD